MGSEYNKWIILAFLIAISFSVTMEGALAARQLMQLPDLPDLPGLPDLSDLPDILPGLSDLLHVINEPPPAGGSTSTTP
ncbi:hypothetical protein LR48_Vigan01g080600 [Vigna angularis]|uniref:Uncharacterized protein n=2 Tax=Phaseolus angularis TaxID=3914 RepID=A0A0L9TL96_PHAAN|nr:uncharacterized protein HKW66_Vig0006600 [Vigna angularis]KOM31251.1 hypothetical protein LR48_Vigan01g080600 [Vigna angularis]BAT73906.1 hypothetical protein VIGAN_01146900 [Vigna angularis var. angularis]